MVKLSWENKNKFSKDKFDRLKNIGFMWSYDDFCMIQKRNETKINRAGGYDVINFYKKQLNNNSFI